MPPRHQAPSYCTGSEASHVGYGYVTTQDGTSRSVLSFFFLRACGWRLRVQPTAIAPYHPIRVARLDSWLKARARSSARVLKVAWRRKRLRSGGLGEPPLHRSADPTDRSRPRSSHLSQVSCQILLVPIGTAHRTPITCHVHRFASSGGPVRVRRSAGVAGGGDGCDVSRNASIWDLRLAVWSWC